MALNFPASPTDGQTYVAPNGVTYVYDATDTLWRAQSGDGENVVFVSATAPVSPVNGKMWWNTDTGTMFIWYNDGNSGQWVPATTPGPAGIQPGQDLEVNSLVSAGDVQAASVNGGHAGPSNLVINGAMQVAQRSTTPVALSGYQTVDRFKMGHSGSDGSLTQTQGSTGGPTGFPTYYGITNTSSTSASNGYRFVQHLIEGQNIRNSGWNHTDPNSKLTLTFKVRSSISQEFYARLYTPSGTVYSFPFSTGVIQANTWTDVSVTIPGNSNLVINNNALTGIGIIWALHYGSDFTDNALTLNQWGVYNSAAMYPNFTGSWGSTVGATFDITGVQLTATDTAVAFQHEDYATTLRKCQRYFYRMTYPTTGSYTTMPFVMHQTSGGNARGTFIPQVPFREAPTLSTGGDISNFSFAGAGTSGVITSMSVAQSSDDVIGITAAFGGSIGNSEVGSIRFGADGQHIDFDADL